MSKKIYHKGTATKIVPVDDILEGHVEDQEHKLSGRIEPGSTVEVTDACGEKLLRMYPKEFVDLSEKPKVKKAADPKKEEKAPVAGSFAAADQKA